MSEVFHNIIGIQGDKTDVLQFLNEGLCSQSYHLGDINHDIAEEGFGKLTLRSWCPMPEDIDCSETMYNLKTLGVKNDSEFIGWECTEEDDENTVICGYIDTTPTYPEEWINMIVEKYPRLTFTIYICDEDLDNCGYFKADNYEWVEKIVKPLYPSDSDLDFYEREIDMLRDNFFKYIAQC